MKTLVELLADDDVAEKRIADARMVVRDAEREVRDRVDDLKNIRSKMRSLLPGSGYRRAVVRVDDDRVAIITDDSSSNGPDHEYAVQISYERLEES